MRSWSAELTSGVGVEVGEALICLQGAVDRLGSLDDRRHVLRWRLRLSDRCESATGAGCRLMRALSLAGSPNEHFGTPRAGSALVYEQSSLNRIIAGLKPGCGGCVDESAGQWPRGRDDGVRHCGRGGRGRGWRASVARCLEFVMVVAPAGDVGGQRRLELSWVSNHSRLLSERERRDVEARTRTQRTGCCSSSGGWSGFLVVLWFR